LAIICKKPDKKGSCLLGDTVGALAKPMTHAVRWGHRHLEKVIKNDLHNAVGRSLAPNGLIAEAFKEGLHLLCVIDVYNGKHTEQLTMRIRSFL